MTADAPGGNAAAALLKEPRRAAVSKARRAYSGGIDIAVSFYVELNSHSNSPFVVFQS
jgi:hypothetical protein